MPNIVIAYHSGFGHTKVIAEHVRVGASSVAGASVTLVAVDELPGPGPDRKLAGAGWDALNAADAIVFGSPTYMGDVSAKFKQFMEYSGGIWFGQGWRDKLAAGFTNSGSASGDKLQALQTMATFAAQHSMIWVSQGVFNKGSGPDGINRLGGWLGYMAQSDNAPPEVTPPKGDRDTAELFGKRVAEAAVRWVRGRG